MAGKLAPVNKEMQAMQLSFDQVTRAPSILTPNQVQKIWNATRPVYKYERPAKGGGTWTYVKASYIRKVLDSVFGFNWDLVITTSDTEIQGWIKMGLKQIVVRGYIEGRVLYNASWLPVRKYGTGRADIKFRQNSQTPLDVGNDIKAAESDLLKKCASKFGIAADVYEDDFVPIEIVGSDENSDRAKATKSKLKEAKKIIKKQSERTAQ